MKVLTLISGGDVGGAKTHVLSLLKGIGKYVEVRLVCFMEAEFSQEARALGLNTTVMSGRNQSAILERLLRMIREDRIDLIHSHGSRGNFMAWMLKKKAGIPLLCTVHSDYRLDYMGRPFANLTYGMLNRLALRQMDYFVGVSDSMSELLIERGVAAPDRVYTIYNGVDFSQARNPSPRSAFFAAHGIPDEPECCCFGIAARLNPVKDVSTLIRGFAAAYQRIQTIRLLIAGDGQEEQQLRELARSLGVADRVHFLGWITDTDSFYNAIDVNVLTSISETFPYALTEGTRFTKATVASRVGGVPKLIDHGVNGLLFTAGDWETLGKHLEQMAKDQALRSRFALALREKTEKYYSLDATVETQRSIYSAVCRRWKRREEKCAAVTICGAYGKGNVGDEAILKAILAEIREIDEDREIFVVSRNPKETARMHRVKAIHTFALPAFRSLMKKSCLYINGGGSLMQDVTSRRSLWFYLNTMLIAKNCGVKVLMYGCGIGPLRYPGDRHMTAKILNRCVSAITLREDNSMEELKKIGVTKPKLYLAADPSLTLNAAGAAQAESALLSAEVPTDGRFVCFALRPWEGFEEKIPQFAEAAERMYRELGLTPVFLLIDRSKDGAAAEAVAERLSVPYYLLPELTEPELVSAVLSKMKAVVSMRLHGLIFAAGQGVPLVGVVYDPKVSAFLRYIGQDRSISLPELQADMLIKLVKDAISAEGETQTEAVRRLRAMDGINRSVLREYLG